METSWFSGMTLALQFVRTLEDSGEAPFICLSSSLLHSKLMLEGRAFPGSETCGLKLWRVGWVIAMTAKLGLLDIQGSDRRGRRAHPDSPCTISNKMPRGIPWTVHLCLQPATPIQQTAQLFLTLPAHHQSRVCITLWSSVEGSMCMMQCLKNWLRPSTHRSSFNM